MKVFRNRLRRMSQSDAARKSGASVQKVSDVVNGRCPPGGKLLWWLGFEVAYVPRRKRARRLTAYQAPDSAGIGPQGVPDLGRHGNVTEQSRQSPVTE